jgi:cellulose synthase/poly-beta-1,6-N-acetylglucosamine synthase-like glycosyltransferase
MVGEGEGVYWIYETRLKQADSDVFSNAFVTGAMTAIRQELFLAIPGYLEFDHILPLHVVNKGFRVAFAMDARFFEETAPSSRAEWNVRVRNAVRGFSMVLLMKRYLNLRKHPWFVLHVYSRKVLRWLVAFPMAGILLSSLLLLDIQFFRLTIMAQVLFYGAALVALGIDLSGRKQGFFALPFYFCLVNAASIVGFFRALQGQRLAVWGTGR